MTLSEHSDAVFAIESLSDGTIVSSGADGRLIRWDLDNGMLLYNYEISYAINVIKEISHQVIAIGGTTNTVNFYKVSGAVTPILISSIDLSSQNNDIYSMVIATISSGSLTSKILYAGGVNSYSTMFNITDVNNITFSEIGGSLPGTGIYAIEKSSILACILFLLIKNTTYNNFNILLQSMTRHLLQQLLL